uniref:Uncharacterized protein n=1 Tax=Ditylenchus dipsaci TaxID=166011 RepID=A0A915DBR6_9BILA
MDSNNSYTELLFEQRRQFVFFVNILLPVMNIQVELLEEGTHVKQVRDSIQATANEASWHRRMISSSTSKSSGLNTPMVEEYCLEQQFSKQQEGSLSPTSSTLSNIWPSSTAYSSPKALFKGDRWSSV